MTIVGEALGPRVRDRWRWEPVRMAADFIQTLRTPVTLPFQATLVDPRGGIYEVRYVEEDVGAYISVEPRGSRHAFYALRRHAKFRRRRAHRMEMKRLRNLDG